MPDTASTTGDLTGQAREIVNTLAASPRFVGSSQEKSARELCRERLGTAGFDTSEEEFSFSAFPARFGPFLCGTVFILGVDLAAHLAVKHRMPLAGIVTAVIAVLLSMILGRFLLQRVLTFPTMRRSSRNLIATRGSAPKVWLVAHTDSKSQTIGMLLRVGSLVLGSVFFLLMLVTMIQLSLGLSVTTEFSDDLLRVRVSILSFLAMITTLPFALCFITNRSLGALDNASGVAAVLLAADLIRADKVFGVILTSGEELALAGAKAFTEGRREKGIAVNCDTIDDRGRFVCLTGDKRARAFAALANGAARHEQKLKIRSTIPGVLTDSIALAEGGWDTCTLVRGNLGTLARVHTSGDKPGMIEGTGIALAARILAATIEELA